MRTHVDDLLRMGRRLVAGLAVALLLGTGLAGVAAAQDIASSGNGGTVTSSANGGAVAVGDTNSGETAGGVTTVGASAEEIIATVFAALGIEE